MQNLKKWLERIDSQRSLTVVVHRETMVEILERTLAAESEVSKLMKVQDQIKAYMDKLVSSQ